MLVFRGTFEQGSRRSGCSVYWYVIIMSTIDGNFDSTISQRYIHHAASYHDANHITRNVMILTTIVSIIDHYTTSTDLINAPRSRL